jgi:phosphodiesterase/alkaline phosphatase D-like protein
MTRQPWRRWLKEFTDGTRYALRWEHLPKSNRLVLRVETLETRDVPAAFLGVSAGDADASSAMLWTRIDQAQSVTAQVSTDPGFSVMQTFGPATTDAAHDFTAKIAAAGLNADTRYYYRFFISATNDTSGTGTFKTAPAANAQDAVKFAFSGDMDGLMRPYALASQVPAEGLDFYANLGDVIYETASNVGGNNGAAYLNSPAVTVSGSAANLNGPPVAGTNFATHTQLFNDYSKKYSEQFLPVNTGGQSALKDFYAGQGDYTLYDNHELGNRQYINGGAPAGGSVGGPTGTDMPTGRGVDARNNGTGNPGNINDANTSTSDFMNRSQGFQTLQQVFLNYQPVKENRTTAAVLPGDNRTGTTKQLFFAQQWGQNAVYIQTDTRSYRDIRLKTADGSADDTGARADNPNRSYFGATQLAWLEQTLLTAEQDGTPWKFVAVSDPIDEIGPIGGSLTGVTGGVGGTMTTYSGNPAYGPVNSDGGKSYIGGYRAERNALLKFIADNHIANVVFLATDDHQNRINEVTYSPTSDTGNQASYVKVPHVFSIVCGPLGATGPDLFLNHNFASVQGAANLIANAESAAGVEPIGLMGYAGLHDVKRDQDGTLVSETTPQAADFYSPDTFNYNVLQVSADGKTLTVTSKGINSTAQNAAAEYGAGGNTIRTIFSFQVDAFNEVPVAQASSVTTSEDTAKTFTVSDFKFTDVEHNPLASITVRALTLASGDTLTVNQGTGAVAVTNGMTITAAQIPTLTYTPAANANGSARSSFNFTVNDAGLGTVAATMTINVTPVNDAPVLTVPGTQTTDEDIAVAITGISVSDVDVNEGTGAEQVTLSVNSGTLTVSTSVAGGLSAAQISGNVSASIVLQGPIAQVNATLAAGVTYLGNLNFHGTDTLAVVANDLGNFGAGGALTDSKAVSIKVLSADEQIAQLENMVTALFNQGLLNQGQTNSLLAKLNDAQSAVDQGKLKVAYNVVGAFKNEVQALINSRRLSLAQAEPLLDAADSLSLSLQIGGGF